LAEQRKYLAGRKLTALTGAQKGVYTGFSRREGCLSRRASVIPRVAPSGCGLEFANRERLFSRRKKAA